MAFEKGHKIKGGRKKGGKNHFHLIRYTPKHWDTSFRNSTYDLEEMEHRINNDLPIDDLIDKMNSKYIQKKKRKDGE